MYERTGLLLDGARKRLALSQESLASSLGVKQQTVSRWMKGESVPRAASIEALAVVLGVPEGEIKSAVAADRRAVNRVSDKADEPVRPLSPTLPFMSLPADRFEQFIADLLGHLYPDPAGVSLLGGQGDDQQGFDVQVVQPDGTKHYFQCKREQQFGPERIKAAIGEAELHGDLHVIALARTATSQARFEIAKHKGWWLWDQVDLSRQVRTLSDERAQRLVRTYFPHHVEDFLGVPPSGPWMTADEFFRNTAFTLLDHQQALVGRTAMLSEMIAWFSDTGESEIGFLVGRGGLGKSKLLHDAALASEGHADVRFLAVGQTPAPSDFDILPTGRPLVLIIDDAHNVDGIAAIAAQLQQHRPGAKLLLATRPYGEAVLSSEIWKLGQSPRRAKQWELADLSMSEARELVATLLNRSVIDPVTAQLAAISFDCPFIAVVAADLMTRDELSASFASDAVLRQEVLSRYGAQLTAGNSSQYAKQQRAVLLALAAYQPVRLSDGEMAQSMTELSQLDDWDEVNGLIRDLEDRGLVLRRGDSVRVVPDILGDVMLAEASFDNRRGAATSFIARAHRAAAGSALQHLLVNASRMEWQLRDRGSTAVDVVGELWTTLRADLLAASYEDQLSLLRLLARIAYYQPGPALELVRALMLALADAPEEPPTDELRFHAGRQDVVHAISPVLKALSYHLDQLPEVLDLLWELAQADTRQTNQHPDHPWRVLEDIADLQTGKPFEYLFAVIDAAERWLEEPSRLSPLDVLTPMLAVEGSAQVTSGLSLTFHAFGLDPASVRAVRKRVIDLAVRQSKQGDVIAAVRGVKVLEASLRGPVGLFQRPISDSEKESWAKEFVPTLAELGSIGADPNLDPAVRIAVRQALSWHAEYGSAITKSPAQRALNRVRKDFIDDLALCLHDGWGRLGLRVDQDYQKAEAARQAEFHRVATSLTSGRSTPEVLELLNERIRVERAALDGISSAGIFLSDVFTSAPEVATGLLDSIEADKYPDLAAFSSLAVGALAERGHEDAIGYAKRLCGSGSLESRRQVAHALSWNRGRRQGLLPGELDLLIELAADEDDTVRASVGRAVFTIGLTDKASAMQLLSKVEFRGHEKVASEALSALIPRGPLSWADADKALQRGVLDQLVDVVSIDEYEITSAVSGLSAIDPVAVTRMLMARVERSAEAATFQYTALPYHWDPPLQIADTNRLSQCLRIIRDWMAENPTTPTAYIRGEDGAQLYARVAGTWSDEAFAILEVTSASTDDQTLAVAQILSRVPVPQFLARSELVLKVLRRAAVMEKDARDDVVRALLPTSGVVMTSWADRPNQDVDERDEARRLAREMPRGSLERQFFTRLANGLDDRIQFRSERRDPSDFDGRDW